jgi:hypothetical protein
MVWFENYSSTLSPSTLVSSRIIPIYNEEPITAQLSFKEEAAGKLRIFAMLDP